MSLEDPDKQKIPGMALKMIKEQKASGIPLESNNIQEVMQIPNVGNAGDLSGRR